MWLDRTLSQEKEQRLHYHEHYESYPINTIEGNPLLRKDVESLKLINVKHLALALILGAFVWYNLKYSSIDSGIFFLGVIWGIFLIVNTQHLSNLIGYKISQKGIHGKIRMHQRTGYYIQSARYFATALFLLILSVLVEDLFIYGITTAAFLSSLRMFLWIWIRKVPRVFEND